MTWVPRRWRVISRAPRNTAPGTPVATDMSDEIPQDDPDLVELLDGPAVVGSPVLVHALSGFLDAGNARKIAVDHLLATLSHRTVATYDIDSLYDYRARRPRMVFETDHFASVDLPELKLEEVTDAAGTKFLLLHGPEPDLGWQRFARSVVELVERFDVRLTVGVNAVPWASPHTRPIGVTPHGTSPELITTRDSWLEPGSVIEVPGHAAALVELGLAKADKPAVGFAVHVPHYLVSGEHPRAALTMLREVANATGLSLPLDELHAAADAADRAIDEQVAQSPENTEAIRMLEAQYDAVVGRRDAGPGLAATTTPLPSGDEIAAQLEEFLRDLGDDAKPDS